MIEIENGGFRAGTNPPRSRLCDLSKQGKERSASARGDPTAVKDRTVEDHTVENGSSFSIDELLDAYDERG